MVEFPPGDSKSTSKTNSDNAKRFMLLLFAFVVTKTIFTFSTAFSFSYSLSTSTSSFNHQCKLYEICNNGIFAVESLHAPEIVHLSASTATRNRRRFPILFSSTYVGNNDGEMTNDDYDYDYDYSSNNYDTNNDLLLLREYLQKYYSAFYQILNKNEEVWKAIGSGGSDPVENNVDDNESDVVGFTVFVPSDDAFQKLGEKKLNQLSDVRNLETTIKIAGYHVVGEPVDAQSLFDAGGVITVSGEVPIERTVSGGMFGIGGKEDGGIALNQAKILNTATVGSGLVHEVDNFVSPQILWRYMDQLRIPGSS